MPTLPACDCLSYCGDDPRVDKKTVRPCDNYRAQQRQARLHAAAPALLHALQTIDSNAAESVEWIRRVAREAINQATGENPQ